MAGNYQPLPFFNFCAILETITLEYKMIPRIILTTTGERIICGLAEALDDNQNAVCLIARCPYILNMTPHGDVSPDGDASQFNVNFTKWIPYSSDEQFRIPYSSVIAIGEVDPGIAEIYLEKFGDKLNDNDTLPASDSSDSAEESGLSDSTD
jgi:hypothetical protein